MQPNLSPIDIDVAVPPDAIELGFDKDGLPRAEPTEKAKTAAPVEPAKKVEAEPPKVTQDDLESARWQTEQANKERDRIARGAEADRQARTETERELQTRTSQAIRAHMHAVNSEHQQIVNALSAVKLETESAKRDLRLALEAAEHDKVAEAQERIALAAADLRTLEQGKIGAQQRLEEAQRAIEAMASAPASREREEPKTREVIPPEQQTPEQWIAQFPPPTQRWLKEHADYVTDPKLHRKLLRFADEFADDHGQNNLHTGGFIDALNSKFFPKKETATVGKEDDSAEVEVAEEPKRRVAAPAAPVSRTSTGGKSPGMTGKVRLSAQEQNAAVGMFPKLTQQEALHKYAQFVKRLEQDGISRDLPSY